MSIQAHRLRKSYAGASAPTLRDLSFEVPAGKCAAILGRSGAGKSTLLRCLVGLEPFDSGHIEVDGIRVEAGASTSLAALRGHVGLVFQSFELFPHLTVLENCVLAPMKVRGTQRAAAERRARELLEQLGLADKGGSFPEMLSGGQKQRVAIARALAMEPRVLLYDEPTSALDPSLRNEVRLTLQRVGQTGMTQVVVTHDVAFAREAADLVFVLDKGQVVESGPPAEVLFRPQQQATMAIVHAA